MLPTKPLCRFLDENPAIDAIEDVASNEDYETWRKITLAVANRPDAQNNRVISLAAVLALLVQKCKY